MLNDADVVVIGSGAGGGTFAYACARAGKRVLLLERGLKYALKNPVHNEQEMLIDKNPYDDRLVAVNGAARRRRKSEQPQPRPLRGSPVFLQPQD